MRWKFIDIITETDEINTIRGLKTFPLNEEWHQDHFPTNAIVPGVLQIEVVANLAGKLILLRSIREHQELVAPILLKTGECRFIRPIAPGQEIVAEVKIDKYNRRIVYSSGVLKVNDIIHAEIAIASARGAVADLGDSKILLPWQIQDILSIYPNPSPEVRDFLQNNLNHSRK